MLGAAPILLETFRMPKFVSPEKLTLFGIVLDRLLAERGWNQQQLSDASDPHVSQGQISNYKNGARRPRPETCEGLARGFASGSDLVEADRERRFQQTFDELMKATGRLPRFGGMGELREQGTTYQFSPDTTRVAERYEGASSRVKKIVDAALDLDEDEAEDDAGPSAARLAFDMDREGARGKRAE